MASKILKGAGKLLDIGKKKKAADPAVAAEQKGPIIKQLGGTAPNSTRRQRLAGFQGQLGSILSDKLGA